MQQISVDHAITGIKDIVSFVKKRKIIGSIETMLYI